jgi:DNA-directed RNA polymerases I, II, and III subunit RPABC5
MIIPVRCFSCNKVIGSKWNKYQSLLQEKKDVTDNIMIIDEHVTTIDDLEHNQDIFKKLNITRYCCKRHLLGHVDILHKL